MRIILAVLAIISITAPAITSDGDQPSVALSESLRLKSIDAKRAYQDVRIGSPRTGVQSVDLDFHRGTGNLFAAIAWGDSWTLNISTDGGATWQETYEYPSESFISMKVGGDFVWVAYSASPVPATLRMRRFFADTGLVDANYNYQSIGNVHPATVTDVAMTSNADGGDSGIYIACATSDSTVNFYWDDLDGISFDPAHPSIVNAMGNLDITWNPGSENGHIVMLSYAGLSSLNVWRLHFVGGWEASLSYGIAGANAYTAISAYRDSVAAIVEFDYTHGNGVTQLVNTNAGEPGEWGGAGMYQPPTPAAPEAYGPDVSLRSPSGSIATYQLEEGSFDGAYYRHLQGHGVGSWGDPVSFSEVDSAAQEQTTVEWLGASCVSSYGIVYTSGGDFIPYFDLVTPRGFFCDGFESGNVSAWD
jgi:hypothetical protein